MDLRTFAGPATFVFQRAELPLDLERGRCRRESAERGAALLLRHHGRDVFCRVDDFNERDQRIEVGVLLRLVEIGNGRKAPEVLGLGMRPDHVRLAREDEYTQSFGVGAVSAGGKAGEEEGGEEKVSYGVSNFSKVGFSVLASMARIVSRTELAFSSMSFGGKSCSSFSK